MAFGVISLSILVPGKVTIAEFFFITNDCSKVMNEVNKFQ